METSPSPSPLLILLILKCQSQKICACPTLSHVVWMSDAWLCRAYSFLHIIICNSACVDPSLPCVPISQNWTPFNSPIWTSRSIDGRDFDTTCQVAISESKHLEIYVHIKTGLFHGFFNNQSLNQFILKRKCVCFSLTFFLYFWCMTCPAL